MKHYRAVFISDIHLGTRGCKSNILDKFLSSFTCDSLYLIGDIIDGWNLSRSNTYFPQEHINIIRKILSKAKKGTKIYYAIGNHDEFLRKYIDFFEGNHFGNIYISNEFVHETIHGDKYWIIHGDLYDGVTRYHKWVSRLGDIGYTILLTINRYLSNFRELFGMPYWSLSAFIKHQVKQAVNFISSFEDTLAKECIRRDYDGIICGHIHHAEIRDIGAITYCNTGDWVESCTALVENNDGKIQVLYLGRK